MKHYKDLDGIEHFINARPSSLTIKKHIPEPIIEVLKHGLSMGNLTDKLIDVGYFNQSKASSAYNNWFRIGLVHWSENENNESIIKLSNWG